MSAGLVYRGDGGRRVDPKIRVVRLRSADEEMAFEVDARRRQANVPDDFIQKFLREHGSKTVAEFRALPPLQKSQTKRRVAEVPASVPEPVIVAPPVASVEKSPGLPVWAQWAGLAIATALGLASVVLAALAL